MMDDTSKKGDSSGDEMEKKIKAGARRSKPTGKWRCRYRTVVERSELRVERVLVPVLPCF